MDKHRRLLMCAIVVSVVVFAAWYLLQSGEKVDVGGWPETTFIDPPSYAFDEKYDTLDPYTIRISNGPEAVTVYVMPKENFEALQSSPDLASHYMGSLWYEAHDLKPREILTITVDAHTNTDGIAFTSSKETSVRYRVTEPMTMANLFYSPWGLLIIFAIIAAIFLPLILRMRPKNSQTSIDGEEWDE